MFSKILIANRGEIAVRIIRACKEMGIASVAVYSEADRDCLHVALADECVCIGPASPKDSYLCQERILSAALLTGAQAIHPGYGFLSENAEFAAACRKNGIAFIGPDAECMARLSDKTSTKEAFAKTALRPIPGAGVLSATALAKDSSGDLVASVTLTGPAAGAMTFNVTGDTLNAILNQRSQDMLTANNWNVVQYAVLTHMMAQVAGLKVGELVHVIADCHIYDRHIPAVKAMLEKDGYPAPTFRMDESVTDFYAFTKDSFSVENYQFHPFNFEIPMAI